VVRSGLGMVDGFIYAYPNAQARTPETPGPARHCDFRGASPHGPRSLTAGGLSWRARQVWHVGMYRDPKTLVPVEYYNRFNLESQCDVAYVPPRPVLRWPAPIPGAAALIFARRQVLDPALSCGSVAIASVGLVKEWGVKNIKLCTFVAAPEGVAAFEAEHPDVPIIVGMVDQGLSPDSQTVCVRRVSHVVSARKRQVLAASHACSFCENPWPCQVPGLGDVGSRFFGTT
jgi:uracil phosphoribosyltransferase